MRLLALDQASRTTGYAVFVDNKLIKYGKIELKNEDLGVRLNSLRDQLIEIIMSYDIDEIIFEDIYLNGARVNNVSTFKVLAEVFGVCDELFTDMEIKHSAVLSDVWQSALGIKGRTRVDQKRNAQQWVIKNYSIAPTQDESDAICIGAYHLKQNNSFDW